MFKMKNNFTIAIDGPVGVGKGTLAAALAKKFDALYINTGAMYRAITLACLEKGIDLGSEKEVLKVVEESNVELREAEGETRVFLNGKKANSKIFSIEVSNAVPITSAYASVRSHMVKKQQEMISGRSVVVEGRDSATHVAPNADLKIFLTASISVRAGRRQKQLLAKGENVSLDKISSDIERRDKLDMEREASPLTIVDDAYMLDTSNLSIDQTVEKVIEKMKEKEII